MFKPVKFPMPKRHPLGRPSLHSHYKLDEIKKKIDDGVEFEHSIFELKKEYKDLIQALAVAFGDIIKTAIKEGKEIGAGGSGGSGSGGSGSGASFDVDSLSAEDIAKLKAKLGL